MNGLRKWALAAYLVLAIYLLARPTTDELAERVQAMDRHFKAQTPSALSPALAATLGMPEQSVECFLHIPNSRPSELVLTSLLDRRGTARGSLDPLTALLESGLSKNEALRYFDDVEKQVAEHLKHCPSVASTDRR